jgi:hypothetical protein
LKIWAFQAKLAFSTKVLALDTSYYGYHHAIVPAADVFGAYALVILGKSREFTFVLVSNESASRGG